MPIPSHALTAALGSMDIMLVDQLMRGRIAAGARVLDAGVGCGRNVWPLLDAGHEVWALDRKPDVLERFAERARARRPDLPAGRFRAEALEHCSLPDDHFDLVICNAVLHFAEDSAAFDAMLAQLWRVTAPGGLAFTRLASSEGLGQGPHWLGDRRAALPDGSRRFLVDVPFLAERTRRLGAELADPLKTTLVHGQRAMTTWVLRKPAGTG